MRATVEGGDGGGDRFQSARRGAADRALRGADEGTDVAVSVMRGSDPSDDARSLVELIEELHRASSDAAAQGLPLMARRLDECGFAFATELADDRSNERELVERARGCFEAWHALREW